MGVKAVALSAVALLGTVAWPCAGPSETPHWSIAKVDFDPYGSGGFLSPANDSRANLLLLLSDRQGFLARSAPSATGKPPLVLMPWVVMAEQAAPEGDGRDPTAIDLNNGSRCQTLARSAALFVAALDASDASAADKAALTTARKGLDADCDANRATVPGVATTTPTGREFSAYLDSAAQFYGGEFGKAQSGFAALSGARDPWVREAALYMVGRTLLNAAIANSIGEWGDIEEADQRDAATAAAAGTAFEAYTKAYPTGRYRNSARGLIRKVLYLEARAEPLLAAYEPELKAVRGGYATVRLIEEIDQKALEPYPTAQPANALMLAVRDLKRMRPFDDYDAKDGWTTLTAAELNAQAPIFRGQEALYGYLRAAHAFWVARDARAVLSLIPDAAHQSRFTALEFSRQLLRGLALDAVKDRNARAFWTSLVPGATGPYQRGAVELALARHDELAGTPERVFAAGSPVTHPVLRDLLLTFSAGPDLLRRQATEGITERERQVALYILLAKQLQRGFYADFVRDYALLPAAPKHDEFDWSGPQYYNLTYNDDLGTPPLWRFRKPIAAGGCPSIRDVSAALAANPKAVRPRLCHAEFLRAQGFDQFEFDALNDAEFGTGGLGSGPPQFPGQAYVRMAVYQAVLADPAATADDRAFALNRMVRCYAPSGYSSCGGEEVGKDVRKTWFDRLKRDYPTSAWAKDLRYYW